MKYYKAEDAIKAIVERFMMNRSYAERMLEDIPTIEGSEDCISRATVLEIFSDLYWIDERLLNFKSELDKVYDELRNAPSVIPKPKEGEWIERTDHKLGKCMEYSAECSVCGTLHCHRY